MWWCDTDRGGERTHTGRRGGAVTRRLLQEKHFGPVHFNYFARLDVRPDAQNPRRSVFLLPLRVGGARFSCDCPPPLSVPLSFFFFPKLNFPPAWESRRQRSSAAHCASRPEERTRTRACFFLEGRLRLAEQTKEGKAESPLNPIEIFFFNDSALSF